MTSRSLDSWTTAKSKLDEAPHAPDAPFGHKTAERKHKDEWLVPEWSRPIFGDRNLFAGQVAGEFSQFTCGNHFTTGLFGDQLHQGAIWFQRFELLRGGIGTPASRGAPHRGSAGIADRRFGEIPSGLARHIARDVKAGFGQRLFGGEADNVCPSVSGG